ncbi:hypothetical protein K1719_014826 [Acacia pycnantha]|nr:hypothetical protein K1719_014826 [Acacia pycnantha]
MEGAGSGVKGERAVLSVYRKQIWSCIELRWADDEDLIASSGLGGINEFNTPALANDRGAASKAIVAVIRDMKKHYILDIIVILEPSISGRQENNVIKSWGFKNSCRMEAEGFLGGIWNLWEMVELVVNVLVRDEQFLHCRLGLGREVMTFTAVYASPTVQREVGYVKSFIKFLVIYMSRGSLPGISMKSNPLWSKTRVVEYMSRVAGFLMNRSRTIVYWILRPERFNKADVRFIPRLGSDHHPLVVRLEEEIKGAQITNWDAERKAWLDQNPEYPNYIIGKARILLLTSSPPKPCDNPIGDHYLLKSIKNKVDYCRLHGIEIVYNMAHLDKELAGYWAKLPMIRRLMLSHLKVEWIWLMDSDAFFIDMVFDLPLSKYDKYNLVLHGYPDLLFEQKSWIAVNTGSFLYRNCQWSLDLLDVWAPMGPKGPTREKAGKMIGGWRRYSGEFLLFARFWAGLVDRYEEMVEKYHPGLGDERWPFVTHFVGCKPCGSYGDYPVERCLSSMDNFADNQVRYPGCHDLIDQMKANCSHQQARAELASDWGQRTL